MASKNKLNSRKDILLLVLIAFVLTVLGYLLWNKFSPSNNTDSKQSVRSSLINYSVDPNHTPSVSPDKKYIFFSYYSTPGTDNPHIKTALMNTTTGEVIQLGATIDNAAWSPNGKLVAYQDAWSKNERGLWVMDLTTKYSRRLVDTTEMDGTSFNSISWSKDSRLIYFSRDAAFGNAPPGSSKNEQEQIDSIGKYKINVDGTGLEKITK